MRHRKKGRKLGRNSSHRAALKRNLLCSLVQHEQIVTTLAKAKEYACHADKLISIAKRAEAKIEKRVEQLKESAEGEVSKELQKQIDQETAAIRVSHNRRAFAILRDNKLVHKLFHEISPRYNNRPGGYTSVLRLDKRRIGDNAPQAVLRLVETAESSE